MRKKLFTLSIFACLTLGAQAQILEVTPPFPTQNDTVTIVYNATQGNGALNGFVPVYAHTGVITQSGGAGSWQFVQGNWGTPDPNVIMTPLGNNRHELRYHIPTFYGFPASTTVNELSFVFRDANGGTVGRSADGSDIFYPVYPANAGFLGRFLSPLNTNIVSQNANLTFKAATNEDADIDIYDNGVLMQSATSAQALTANFQAGSPGTHLVEMVADNGTTVIRDTAYYVVNATVQTAPAPAGTEDGINYLSNTSVVLQLHAPFKNNIYVIGDFNNWQPDPNYFMKKTPTGDDWWVQIDNLTPGQPYAFQYLIDGDLRVGDPYSELILDPWNDQWIDSLTFPNMPPYPTGKTTGIVSVLNTDEPDYVWKNTNFQAPAKDELITYELLVRDFVAAHNYQTLIDTLDYLSRLGINAIELMPVNEFEGNESWGYNPSYHLALDKYYGTKNKFKEFIDSCHSRDIAIILDAVLNHAFGQSPLVQMYFDPNTGQFGQPTAQNPWFNQVPTHDFNVGYDFNHDSPATRVFMERAVKYWLEEYKIDGYRFDLSKGFTQNNTLGNIAAWNAYDQSRVDNLNRIKGWMEQVNPNSYPILEHLGDNNEETALSNQGFMLWGKMTTEYGEAAMGYIGNSDFKWAFHSERGHNFKHLMAYAESHDEERIMRKLLDFGNGVSGYDTKNLNTALARMELISAFLYTIPGPKMLWQFGELGYDVSINTPSRTGNKPILWNYQNVPARARLYDVTSKLITMRVNYPTFNSNSYRYDFSGNTKRLNLDGSDFNATIIGNFDVVQQTATPQFQGTGWWYDYMTGDSINVNDPNAGIALQPGEYRVYTDKKVTDPRSVSLDENPLFADGFSVYPNPANAHLTLSYTFAGSAQVEGGLYNVAGQKLLDIAPHKAENASTHEVNIEALPAGLYLLKLNKGNTTITRQVMKR